MTRLNRIHSSLLGKGTRNDKQFRYFQYCLMNRKKRCLLEKAAAAIRHFRIALPALGLNGFRNHERILVPLMGPPTLRDYLSPLCNRIAARARREIAEYACLP